jgi:hypothetical protein
MSVELELRQYQKDIIPRGVQVLKKHYMVWLTGQERAGKTFPALGIIKDSGFKKALCITTINASIDIKDAYKYFQNDYQLDIVNYASAHKYLSKKDEYQVVWLDESHKLSQCPTPAKTVTTVKSICQNKYIIYSTGTPSGEGYHKLYHQFFVSSASPLAAYKNFYAFAKEFITVRYQKAHGRDIKVWSDVNIDKLYPMIKHLFITWTREDAGFKVDAEDKILTVKMSDEAIAIFKKLKRDKIYIDSDGNVATISGGAEMINKLNQIGNGTLKYDDLEEGKIIDTSKAEFIKKEFEGQKIAIFFKFIAEGKLLRSYFPNHTDVAKEFNSRNDLVFIGQVKSFCEGVDLSSADCIVNYNMEFSATVYSQSRARLLSLNRTKPAPVYFIFPEHGIDHKIYQAVSNKKNFTWSYYANNPLYARKTNTSENQKSTGETRMDSPSTHQHQQIGTT